MTVTTYTVSFRGVEMLVFDAALAEALARDGHRVTAATRSDV